MHSVRRRKRWPRAARSRGALIRRHSWKGRASDDYDEVLWYIGRECSLISRRTGWCRGATAPTRVEGFPCRPYAYNLASAHTVTRITHVALRSLSFFFPLSQFSEVTQRSPKLSRPAYLAFVISSNYLLRCVTHVKEYRVITMARTQLNLFYFFNIFLESKLLFSLSQ